MIKKTILIVLLMMSISISANAYTGCVGGTVITRNQYGAANAPSSCTSEKCPSETKTFCKSTRAMNWWSAFNWCKSNGGTLASFSSMCPGVKINAAFSNEGACPALQGTGGVQYVWSPVGYGGTDALCIHLSLGSWRPQLRSSTFYALCE